MNIQLRTVGALLVCGVLGACAVTSSSFVDQRAGYSVIRGRITKVENLSASSITRFGDGMAVTVSKPGCKVSIDFKNQQEGRTMEVGPGVILVYGGTLDYVLQAAPGMPAR